MSQASNIMYKHTYIYILNTLKEPFTCYWHAQQPYHIRHHNTLLDKQTVAPLFMNSTSSIYKQ
jgi:hypothetical protein